MPGRVSTELLPRMRALLSQAFGDRFRGLILFGSEARGEAREDSDIDLLVLLAGPVDFGVDARSVIRLLYPIQMEIERPLHATPVAEDDYLAGEFGLYRKARKEGIAA